MKRSWIIVGLVVAALSVGGYYGFRYVLKQKKLLTGICYKFVDYKVNQFSLSRVNIEITIALKNRSDIGISLSGYRFDISINGNRLTTIAAKESVSLTPNTWVSLPLIIDFSPKDIGKNIISADLIGAMLVDKENVIIGINGSLSAGALGFSVEQLPINVSMPMSQFKGGAPKSPDPSKQADCADAPIK